MSDSIYDAPATVAAENMTEAISKYSLGLDKRAKMFLKKFITTLCDDGIIKAVDYSKQILAEIKDKELPSPTVRVEGRCKRLRDYKRSNSLINR